MPIRVLLAGCGDMGGGHHLPALQELGSDVTLAGIVRATSAPVAVAPGVAIFTDFSSALDRTRPELVIIATPHHLHAEQVRVALDRGCHVLVEKPLATEFTQVEELVASAAAQNRLLVLGLQRRYEAFCIHAHNLTRTGRLGTVQFVHGLFAHSFSSAEPAGWRADPKSAGAGILDDSAYHVVDVLLTCAGGTLRRLVGAHIQSTAMGQPHSFTAMLETDYGTVVSVSGSYLAPRLSVQEELSVYGTNGTLFARRFCREWNTSPPAIFFKSRDGEIQEDLPVSSYGDGRSLPLRCLIDVLLGRRAREELRTEAKNTVETHRAIHLIKKCCGPTSGLRDDDVRSR